MVFTVKHADGKFIAKDEDSMTAEELKSTYSMMMNNEKIYMSNATTIRKQMDNHKSMVELMQENLANEEKNIEMNRNRMEIIKSAYFEATGEEIDKPEPEHLEEVPKEE